MIRIFVFTLLVSIFSRVLWSRKYPYGNLRYEVNYMGAIMIFNLLWFAFCAWAFGFRFP